MKKHLAHGPNACDGAAMRAFPFLSAATLAITAFSALSLPALRADTKAKPAAPSPSQAARSGDKSKATTAAIAVEFATGEGAVKAITDDSADPYFSKLKPLETALKTASPLDAGEEAKAGEVARERYGKLTLEFTDKEKTLLRTQTAKVDEACALWPLYRDTPWRFVKVSNKLEGGLPHTRGGWIVMPENVLASLGSGNDRAVMALQQLLIHEKIHVHQRQHPGFYDSLYTKVWNWKKVPGVKLPDAILDREIHNPDGVNAEWALQPAADGKESIAKSGLLLPILQVAEGGDELPMAQALSMQVVTLKTLDGGGKDSKDSGPFSPEIDESGGVILKPLPTVEDFQKAFPASSSNYHPNEVTADIFSSIVLMDALLPPQIRENPKLKEVAALLEKERSWFKEHFTAKVPAAK